MSTSSKIEWTETTWNPVVGCTRKSRGCDSCYAVRHTRRLAGKLPIYEGLVSVNRAGHAHFNGTVRTVSERLEQPLAWRKPRRVFVNSMSDLFHQDVPDEFIDRVFAVMALASQHTFQVLTKRPERMTEYFRPIGGTNRSDWVWASMARILNRSRLEYPTWPLPNVWLGTSIEDQDAAEERIPHLLRCPAAVRFLSCEPLLGPVDLGVSRTPGAGSDEITVEDDALGPPVGGIDGIDWVIVGGESGPGARPCDVEWIRSLLEQCQAAGVPAFVKQLGARPVAQEGVDFELEDLPSGVFGEGKKARAQLGQTPITPDGFLHLEDRKGGDPREWPEDLRVREFPLTVEAVA